MIPEPWDGESFCVGDGCRQPATVLVPYGMVDDQPVSEWMCQECAEWAELWTQ